MMKNDTFENNFIYLFGIAVVLVGGALLLGNGCDFGRTDNIRACKQACKPHPMRSFSAGGACVCGPDPLMGCK